MRTIFVVAGLAALLMQSIGCSSQSPGPDDWYRVDPLFNTGANAGVSSDGSLNPYRFRFPEQPGSDEAAATNTRQEYAEAVGQRASKQNVPQTERHTKPHDHKDPTGKVTAADGQGNPPATVPQDFGNTVASRRKARQAVLGLRTDAGSQPVNGLTGSEEAVKTATPAADPTLSAADEADLAAVAMRTSTSAYEASRGSKLNRDRYIGILVAQSDALVGRHVASIIGTQNAAELGLSTTALVTSSLATVFSPPGTKSALSAASAVATGTRGAIREQIYSNAFGWAIGQAIVDTRSEIYRTKILPNLNQDIDRYTIDHALADIQAYHESGSFYMGLMAINKRIAAGDRTGLFPKTGPEGSLKIMSTGLTAWIKDDRSVNVKIEFKRSDDKVYKIVFANAKSVQAVEPKSRLVKKVDSDKDGLTYELLLPGTIEFKIVPAFQVDDPKNDDDKLKGFKAVVIKMDDGANTQYVIDIGVETPKAENKPESKPENKPEEKPSDKPNGAGGGAAAGTKPD